MNMTQMVIVAIVVVPFVEMYLLLAVGGVLGALPTIALVVLTAVAGAALLRQQGLDAWRRFRQALAQGQIPAYELIEGPIILVGGALLLTPGFITDALGIACLVPSWRRAVARHLLAHFFRHGGPVQPTAKGGKVLEGEFQRDD